MHWCTYSFLLLCKGKTSKVQKCTNADMKTYCMFYCMFSSYENNMPKTSKNRIKELWHELFDMDFYVYVKGILCSEKIKVKMTLTLILSSGRGFFYHLVWVNDVWWRHMVEILLSIFIGTNWVNWLSFIYREGELILLQKQADNGFSECLILVFWLQPPVQNCNIPRADKDNGLTFSGDE